MFIGMDHGTTAIRFATDTGSTFELSRNVAKVMSSSEILESIEVGLGISFDDLKLIALTYSMGDNFSSIESVKSIKNRGVESSKAGTHIGGGTKVFDTLKESGLPAIMIPGLHDATSTIDPRLKIFSHGASPEKVGIAYHAFLKYRSDLIVSDMGSNTVTVGLSQGKIVGAFDACIFAPGIHHGPLDMRAIQKIDEGVTAADEAFSNSGVLKRTSIKGLEELLKGSEEDKDHAFKTLALFSAMEISAMKVLLKDYGAEDEKVVLAGSLSEIPLVKSEIERLLSVRTFSVRKWSAAQGCAEIARDVYQGEKEILGIKVNYNIK